MMKYAICANKHIFVHAFAYILGIFAALNSAKSLAELELHPHTPPPSTTKEKQFVLGDVAHPKLAWRPLVF